MGFFSWRLIQSHLREFIWLANYKKMITSSAFWESIGRTVIFTISTVSLQFMIGFVVAIAVVRLGRSRRFVSALILMPMMIPSVVAGLSWNLLFEPQFGFINYILSLLSLPSNLEWLASPSTALFSIIIVETWRNTPFVVLVLSAGLMMLPDEPYEAAYVDGATSSQIFVYITLPMLVPIISLVLVVRFMDALRAFAIVYVLTKGGPGRVTELASIHVYSSAFEYLNLGYGSVLAQALFILVLIASLLIIYIFRKKDE